VFYNFRSLRRAGRLEAIETFNFRYLPVFPSPFPDIHAQPCTPVRFACTGYLRRVRSVCVDDSAHVLFWKRLPRTFLVAWCIFVVLFLLLSSTRLLGIPVALQRWWMIVINSASLVFGLIILIRLIKWVKKQRIILLVVLLYLLFNLLAIVCNIFRARYARTDIRRYGQLFVCPNGRPGRVYPVAYRSLLLQIQSSRVRKNTLSIRFCTHRRWRETVCYYFIRFFMDIGVYH